jgi:hypothetical protein
MSDVRAVVVPRDLYYHEIAYVRRLEALYKAASDLIADMAQHEGAEGFSDSTRVLEAEYEKLRQEHEKETR